MPFRAAIHRLKTETYALYLAYRDPRTPWYARAWSALVVAYAFSPIDFIPDFIPVVGYLDDILLLPVGIWLALKMIPADVMADARRQAQTAPAQPTNRMAAAAIVAVWLLLAAGGVALTGHILAG
jgi:uncharacterized membrane protein YkvA (DUF1232 family)